MFSLGLVALLQIWLLPGALAYRLMGLRLGMARAFIFSVILSLPINYILVSLSVFGGFYTQLFLFSIIGIELTLLSILTLRQREFPLRTYLTLQPSTISTPTTIDLTIIATIVLIAILFVIRFFQFEPGVFVGNDPLLSWNRWAIDWANGIIPRRTQGYPQLLPALWSITYVLIGTTKIQFFSHAVNDIFAFVAIFAFANLMVTKRDIAHVGATLLLTYALLGPYKTSATVFSGYSDYPLGLLFLVALYFLIISRHALEDEKLALLFGGAIAAGCAALTKGNGIILLLSYIVLVALLSSGSLKRRLKYAGLSLGISLVLVALWYVYYLLQLYAGTETNLAPTLAASSFHEGRNLAERAGYALWMLWAFQSPGTVIISVISFILAFRIFEQKWIVLIGVIPYLIFWALTLSYGIRNLFPLFPLISVVIGWSLGGLLQEHTRDFWNTRWTNMELLLDERVKRLVPIFSLTSVAFLLLLILFNPISESQLYEKQKDLHWDIGQNRESNIAIISKLEEAEYEDIVLTNYPYLGYLSNEKGLKIVTDFALFQDGNHEKLQKWIYDNQPRYILIRRTFQMEQTDSFISRLEKDEQASLVLSEDNFSLYKMTSVD